MRQLRLILQRLRAFRLTRKCFSLGYLKSRYRARRVSSNSRSSPLKTLSMAKCQKSRPAFIGRSQHCGKSAGLDQLLLLACNPCAASTTGMVVDSYKFQVQGNKKIPAKCVKNKAVSGEIWEKEKSWNIVTQVGDEFVTKKVILKKKSKKKLAREEGVAVQPPAPGICDQLDEFSGSCSSSRYRLSTSSSAADDQNLYSWDKELSFASGDDRYLDEDRFSSDFLDRLEATSKDVFIDPPAVMGSHFLDDSFFSLDNYIRSVQSAGDKHFPSPDCTSTFGDLELEDPEQQPKKMVSSSSCGTCDCGLVAQDPERKERKVGGVAVAKISLDPYRDYKDSMLEMSAANGLEKMSEFRELLQCYLSLNPPEFHATIMEVFTELFWHRLV